MLKQKIKFVSSLVSNNIFMANIVIAIMFIVSISMYLSQINTTTQLGLQVESIESNLMKSKEISKDLQLEVASLQSITSLQERVQDMKLAQVSHVNYVSVAVPTAAVAKR